MESKKKIKALSIISKREQNCDVKKSLKKIRFCSQFLKIIRKFIDFCLSFFFDMTNMNSIKLDLFPESYRSAFVGIDVKNRNIYFKTFKINDSAEPFQLSKEQKDIHYIFLDLSKVWPYLLIWRILNDPF